MLRSLLIVGGTGFVGSAAARYAISQGVKVMSLSPSGAPKQEAEWTKHVTYIKGSAFDQSTYKDALNECNAVIHTVGTLFDSQFPINYND